MKFDVLNRIAILGREYGHRNIRNNQISDTGHQICAFLFFHGPSHQEAIANYILVDKTTITKAVKSLLLAGCIDRVIDNKDKRKKILSITRVGETLIRDTIIVFQKWIAFVTKDIDEEELGAFNTVLTKIYQAALLLSEEFSDQSNIGGMYESSL